MACQAGKSAIEIVSRVGPCEAERRLVSYQLHGWTCEAFGRTTTGMARVDVKVVLLGQQSVGTAVQSRGFVMMGHAVA